MSRFWTFLLAFGEILFFVNASENGVSGEPRVFCGPEGIHVLVRTHTAFRGRLFVQEESERSECMHSYVDGIDEEEHKPTDNSAEFHLKFGTCNMRRQRTLTPRGVTFSFTLVVSFHALFLTGSDRAFNVRCFFVEAVKAVDAALDVSPMATQVIEQEFPLPRCNYYLKQGNRGSILRYANVGDPVTHVWECDPSAGWVYGVLIHSCYADDGRGNRFELINGRGCTVDKLLLGDLSYDEHGINAYVDSRVFKYADRIQLFFTCTVQLCFRQGGGCDGITPPKCGLESKSHGHEFPIPHSPKLPSPTYIQQPNLHNHSPTDIFRQIARNRVFRPPTRPRKGDSSEYDGYDRLLKDDVLLSNETIVLNENSTETGKRSSRDALNAMETDLSAELVVMPLDNSGDEATVLPPEANNHCIQQTNSSDLCLNKMNIFSLFCILILSIFITIFFMAFFLIRRRRRSIHQQMPRKIFLTD